MTFEQAKSLNYIWCSMVTLLQLHLMKMHSIENEKKNCEVHGK